MDYQQRQVLIEKIAQEFILSRPNWEARKPRKEGKRRRSGAAVAAANIRRLIKEHCPHCVAKVRVDGSEVLVDVLTLPGHPSARTVRSWLDYFVDRRWNSQSETFDFDEDEERAGFRRAFGGCSRLSVNERRPTADQLAKYMNDRLPEPTTTSRRPRL